MFRFLAQSEEGHLQEEFQHDRPEYVSLSMEEKFMRLFGMLVFSVLELSAGFLATSINRKQMVLTRENELEEFKQVMGPVGSQKSCSTDMQDEYSKNSSVTACSTVESNDETTINNHETHDSQVEITAKTMNTLRTTSLRTKREFLADVWSLEREHFAKHNVHFTIFSVFILLSVYYEAFLYVHGWH